MYPTASNRLPRPAESRVRRRRQRRGRARKRQLGQTLVIFALSVTVLLGLASLAIDAMRAYDLYAREERAAEAGALAGVLYMPCSYDSSGPNPAVASSATCASTTSPDGLTARRRALQEVQKNGFGTSLTPAGMPDGCLGRNTTAEVTVCGVSGRTNALQVTISEPITTFFLFTSISGTGNQSFMVTATAGADYLNSYVLGDSPSDSGSNAWGDANTNTKYWVPAINGPAEFKENGDPFVYCEEGPSGGPLNSAQYPTSNGGADENLWQGGTQSFGAASPLFDLGKTAGTGGGLQADSGQLTNHPQLAAGPACGVPGSAQATNGGNPDQQPSGFAGEATKNTVHPGAYNFVINVPKTSTGVDVWIWNAAFDPGTPQSSCNGAQPGDRFPMDIGCNNYYTDYGVTNSPTTTCTTAPCPMIQLNTTAYASAYVDDPRLYFNTTYSIYAMSNNGQPGTTLATGTAAQTFKPYDTTANDLVRHLCPSAVAPNVEGYDVSADNSFYNSPPTVNVNSSGQGLGCALNPPGVMSWVPVNADALGNRVALTTPGNYRLAIEATTLNAAQSGPNPACNNIIGLCGWGHHVYAILVCQAGGPAPTGDTCPTGSGGGKIAAWNNMDIYLNFPSSSKPWEDSTPLANIPADFAGHTIEIGLYDPGDSHSDGGSNWFIIIPPDCSINPKGGAALPYGNGDGAGHTQPQWVRTATYPISNPLNAPACQQDRTSMFTSNQNGSNIPSDSIYNGLWIWTRITLPDGYSGGEWYMNETSQKGKDFDQYTIAFRLDDPSPVHIIF